jgi:hypothetical protein
MVQHPNSFNPLPPHKLRPKIAHKSEHRTLNGYFAYCRDAPPLSLLFAGA